MESQSQSGNFGFDGLNGLVIRFSTVANNVTLHRKGCSSAKPKKGVASYVVTEATQDEIDDLIERGFGPVRRCRCCKEA